MSLIELIARPERYDGKLVLVHGFANLEFEGNALYVSRGDWENSITKNAVWLDDPPWLVSGSKEYRPNRRYVLVRGRFNARDTGHMGLFSGAIEHISMYRGMMREDEVLRPDEVREHRAQ